MKISQIAFFCLVSLGQPLLAQIPAGSPPVSVLSAVGPGPGLASLAFQPSLGVAFNGPASSDYSPKVFDGQWLIGDFLPQKHRPGRASDEMRFGMRLAGGLASYIVRGGNLTVNTDNRLGLMVGPMLDLPVSDLFFVQTGLTYTLRGTGIEEFGFKSSATFHTI
jgi:hypothetical protein